MNEKRETTVKLEGVLGLRDAPGVNERLEGALGVGEAVVVDARELVEIDISILQLLIAARISAMNQGVELRLLAEDSGAVQGMLERIGLSE